DNQVKLRGFRVELDEIRHAIEAHDWVRNAAVIVTNDARTGHQNLVSFVELNPKEAALMDQGSHGAHHQSKQSRLQVRAQLANLGCREEHETSGKPVVDLPGATATAPQRRLAFARKTYRFYDGGPVRQADILRLLSGLTGRLRSETAVAARGPGELGLAELGEILRHFGPHLSDERVLPKYAYASPGALNATQMYLEANQVAGLRPGYYYFHPVRHQLILIGRRAASATPTLRVHFIGKRRAIEPVYRNNIREVLEIETGHMLGLFERVLPGYGLGITPGRYAPATKDRLECAGEDYYLGSFAIVPADAAETGEPVDLYVQAHPDRVADLLCGQYRYRDGALEWLAPDLVAKQHVIAINQQVYARSSFGVTVVSRAARPWLHYISLGRTLQLLQHNELNLGFMSSGYSSKTGNDLPAARR
ncbi:MAG: hypothetical protein L0Y54_21615, partial [Sporichthyaceae bacterium]|nr:hypothetical protein [Sporichthyaceae bacterium]